MKQQATSVLDTVQGFAKDICYYSLEANQEAKYGIVDITLQDEDQLSISFADVIAFVPLERIRALLRT